MKKMMLAAAALALAAAAMAQPIAEDFEGPQPSLVWAPLAQSAALNGQFSVVPNPDPAGNASLKAAKYVKGVSPFSALEAVLPADFDLLAAPKIDLDVWAPAGAKTLTLQLASVANGAKEASLALDETQKWRSLSFDLTAAATGAATFERLRLIFDGGAAAPGAVYFFDNLRQNGAPIDPCAGTAPQLDIIDDFECQRNFGYGAGAALLAAVANPQIGTTNPSPRAGRYSDPPDAPQAALSVEFPDGLDLSDLDQFEFLLKAPASGMPFVVRLDGGSTPAFETAIALTSSAQWGKYRFDFSGQKTGDWRRLSLLFNVGQNGPGQDWFLDDLRFARANYTGCAATFETPSLTLPTWGFFENGSVGAAGFAIVGNPSKTGLNVSENVGKAVEAGLSSGATQPWGGMYVDLSAPIRFTGAKKMRMKALMPAAPRKVTMKLEGPSGSTPDNTVTVQKAGEWAQLEWDFSSASSAPIYSRITLIWNIDAIPATDQTYFFDDIEVGAGGACAATVGAFAPEPPPAAELSIWPNPATCAFFIENAARAARFELFDALGRRAATWLSTGEARQTADASGLAPGVYWLIATDRAGHGAGQGRIVKM